MGSVQSSRVVLNSTSSALTRAIYDLRMFYSRPDRVLYIPPFRLLFLRKKAVITIYLILGIDFVWLRLAWNILSERRSHCIMRSLGSPSEENERLSIVLAVVAGEFGV